MAKSGRKSKYEKKILPNWETIKEYLKKGFTEKEIADKIGVSESTWFTYKKQFSEFSELINAREVDTDVIEEARSALHRRATGYHYIEKKIVKKVNEDGEMEVVQEEEYLKYEHPDTNAINLFLKNYDRDNWSNDPQMLELRKREIELKEKEFNNNNW